MYRSGTRISMLTGFVTGTTLALAYAFVAIRGVAGTIDPGGVVLVIGAFTSVSGTLGQISSTFVAVDQHTTFLDDYFSSYQGNRFAESVRYVRAYPADLPVLADLLPQIDTPVQVIAGAHDAWLPPANAEFLARRLPRNRLDIIDAGHFTWEDAAGEYAALVTSWWKGGHSATGSVPPH